MADAGRVIAGTARGVRLAAPGAGTRPLTDRVKQTLFGILEPDLPDAAVLDLFAGSGAGGIEALSRGARLAVFVEDDRGAARVLAGNVGRAGFLGASAVIVQRDAIAYLEGAEAAAAGPFDIVLADPPYDRPDLLLRVLTRLGAGADRAAPLLATGARVVAKHFWRTPPPPEVGLLASERERRFGDTVLTFYRRAADAEEAPSA